MQMCVELQIGMIGVGHKTLLLLMMMLYSRFVVSAELGVELLDTRVCKSNSIWLAAVNF